MTIIANGKQSIYELFDAWRSNAKLEAEYMPSRFFELYYDKTLSDLEQMEFYSNFELWQMCNGLRSSITVLQNFIHPDDE